MTSDAAVQDETSAPAQVQASNTAAQAKAAAHPGWDDLFNRPLMDTLLRRRTHRVSRGIARLNAGSMTYESDQQPVPLTELEEAVLIAATGHTGLTMPDRPFTDADNNPVMAKPNLSMDGRTAGSPDNAQGTHFFMINDSGTYFLKKLAVPANPEPMTPQTLIARAKQAKIKICENRLDVGEEDRAFPAYLDSNRLLSNLRGTTIFFPVVDLSHQYINGLMYLLTQPEGHRPTFRDDRNFYLKAGVAKWVRNRFLNDDKQHRIPLGSIRGLRTEIEADLLLQNIMLVSEAMGLGAYIHATIGPPVLTGHPSYVQRYGQMLGFDYATPKWRLLDILRWGVLLPCFATARSHPIGLKHDGEFLIKCKTPPNYATMKDAVDEVVAGKFGDHGIYNDPRLFGRIYKGDLGDRYLNEAKEYSKEVIACVTDICEHIYKTHRRFPAHMDAIHVPGVWIQVHHPDRIYYDQFFRNGLTQAHRDHDQLWH